MRQTKCTKLTVGVAKSHITNATDVAIHDPLYTKILVLDDCKIPVVNIAIYRTAIGD